MATLTATEDSSYSRNRKGSKSSVSSLIVRRHTDIKLIEYFTGVKYKTTMVCEKSTSDSAGACSNNIELQNWNIRRGRTTQRRNINLRSSGLMSLLICFLIADQPTPTVGAKCEPITVPMCQDMPWNLTHMPNLVHHSSQKNAELVLSQFGPLLQRTCSRYLKFFLCSMFTPMCFHNEGDFPKIIPPCRKICVDARDNCEPIMLKYNVTWPEQLSCDDLPEYHRGMCIAPDAFIAQKKETKPSCSVTSPAKCKKCKKTRVKDKKVFMEKKYDYVIRAKVEKVTQRACDAQVKVNVTRIMKKRTIEFGLGMNVLIFNGTCACPKLKRGREYVLTGHESERTGELFLHGGSMAEKWSRKWEKKLLKWMKTFSHSSLNRRRRQGATEQPKDSPKGRSGRKKKRIRA